MNDECWKDDLSDDELGDPGEDDYVVLPQWKRGKAADRRPAQPPFKVLYGPAGAVRMDLERAHRQMNIAAAASKRPGDPRRN